MRQVNDGYEVRQPKWCWVGQSNTWEHREFLDYVHVSGALVIICAGR